MCKSRRVPAVAVGVSSIIVFLLGVAMLVLTIMFNSNGFKDDMAVLSAYKNAAFIVLLIGSSLAVITAIASGVVALKKNTHWCCNINLGIFMFFSWVLLILAGIVMGSITLTKEETFISFCDN
jgi:hypothetical protein